MATLLELHAKVNDSDLQDRVEVALVIGVQALLDGATPTDSDKKYAAMVFANPKAEGRKALMAVLAKNEAATIAQINAASDATIKTQVAEAIDALSVAYNAGLV